MADRKAFKATWLGDGDPQAQVITMFGLRFIKGEATRVPANLYVEGVDAYDAIHGNPMFSVEGEDDDADLNEASEEDEIDGIKSQLDLRGIKYRANASAESLRKLLADA